MPNVETKVLLVQIFGEKSHPIRKYQRLLYWFPRFKHTNPYPVPHQLPEDPVDLARLSLKRIADDLDAKVTVYQVKLLRFVFGQNMPVFLNVTIWPLVLDALYRRDRKRAGDYAATYCRYVKYEQVYPVCYYVL